MKIEITDELLQDAIDAAQEAFINTQKSKYLALYTYFLNMQAAEKYRKESNPSTSKLK